VLGKTQRKTRVAVDDVIPLNLADAGVMPDEVAVTVRQSGEVQAARTRLSVRCDTAACTGTVAVVRNGSRARRQPEQRRGFRSRVQHVVDLAVEQTVLIQELNIVFLARTIMEVSDYVARVD